MDYIKKGPVKLVKMIKYGNNLGKKPCSSNRTLGTCLTTKYVVVGIFENSFLTERNFVNSPPDRAGSGQSPTRNLACGPWILSDPTRARFWVA